MRLKDQILEAKKSLYRLLLIKLNKGKWSEEECSIMSALEDNSDIKHSLDKAKLWSNEKHYWVTFNLVEERDASIMVHKKTPTINKVFFVPKSIIKDTNKYEQVKKLWKDVPYTRDRIALLLPKWFCDKELEFYV